MNVLQHTRNERNLFFKRDRADRYYRDCLLNFRKQLLFLVSLFSSSLERAHMFFPLFCLSASSQILNADVQYMVKSYMSNAEKNSGLNLSGLGLKTAMITATLCSTPSRTKATYWLILCKKALNF